MNIPGFDELPQINLCSPEFLKIGLCFPDRSQCEGSQSNSSSGHFNMTLSEFLEAFPNPPRQMPSESGGPWVFCSQSENNNSSSADVGTTMNIIHDKIKSAFSNICLEWWGYFAQFWAPVIIDGRLQLSTSRQPFALTHLFKDYVVYRLDSEKYQYNIDVMNKLQNERDSMIVSDGPATAFLNRLPCINRLHRIPLEEDYEERWTASIMLPICFFSESYCVGVLEFIIDPVGYNLGNFVLDAMEAIKSAGLDVCTGQEHIPYKSINGLRAAKDEIKHALEIVCGSHNLSLAQVWIAFEDKSHVPLSSYLEDTRRIFGLKFTGYLHVEHPDEKYNTFVRYSRLCDVMPLRFSEELALKTLQHFKSCYISTLHDNVLLDWKDPFHSPCALAICLRSIDTGDFNFAFKFIWLKQSRCDILLESILLTLKRRLPSFKFACGADLGDELDVIDITSSKGQTSYFKIFQGKSVSPIPNALEEGKQPIIVDYIAPSEVTCNTTSKVLPLEDIDKQLKVISVYSPTQGETSNIKVFPGKRLSTICKSVEKEKRPMVKYKTAEILLTREVIEKQFGKPMKEALDNLHVSQSTLKRKMRKLGILEWPRTKPLKRNKNGSCINQINTNEEINAAIQEPLTNHIILTIEAQYINDMIIFPLRMSEATFVTLDEKIGTKFKLSVGTYKLKYLDEFGRMILLTSDDEMSYCIKSSRKSDGRFVVQLSVQLCTQTN